MHAAACVSWGFIFLSGCATTVPHEYLDTDSAATITVVANPWIFVSDDGKSAFDRRGFLNLYATDVNRAGNHERYFAVMQSSFDVRLPDNKSTAPVLELQAGDLKIVLQSTAKNLRQLGVAQPFAEPFAAESRWWCFPVTKDEVAAIAQMRNPQVTLVARDARFTYVEFRNGSKELAELSATLR